MKKQTLCCRYCSQTYRVSKNARKIAGTCGNSLCLLRHRDRMEELLNNGSIVKDVIDSTPQTNAERIKAGWICDSHGKVVPPLKR